VDVPPPPDGGVAAGDKPPPLRWAVLPDPAARSLAPLRAAELAEDPGGGGDSALLACCGEGPTGRLAVCRWGGELVALASGEDMPVRGGWPRRRD
jgi:hypothetical protein